MNRYERAAMNAGAGTFFLLIGAMFCAAVWSGVPLASGEEEVVALAVASGVATIFLCLGAVCVVEALHLLRRRHVRRGWLSRWGER